MRKSGSRGTRRRFGPEMVALAVRLTYLALVGNLVPLIRGDESGSAGPVLVCILAVVVLSLAAILETRHCG